MAQFDQRGQHVDRDQINIEKVAITVLSPPVPETLQTELRGLSDRLTAFRLLESRWLEEVQQSEQNLRFYEGFRASWSDLIRDLDAKREQFPTLLELAKGSASKRSIIAILAEMGSGKTTVLKRLALELYLTGSIVLYYKETARDLSADEIRQLVEQLKDENASRPLYLCIDDAARVSNLSEFVSQLADYGIKAALLLASRTSEWRDANLAITANLDYDLTEISLAEHFSFQEVEELSAKVRLYNPGSQALKLDGNKNILVAMMEATGGRGFQEIIKERIGRLRRKGPLLLAAYEYACLLGQFDLSLPVSVLEALFPTNDILTELLTQPFFREVVQFSEDGRRITAGHELLCSAVINQQYGKNHTSEILLVEMYTRLIHNVPREMSSLTMNLLLRLARLDKQLGRKVLARNERDLDELIPKSTIDDLSRNWAQCYEIVGDDKSAQKCHLISINLAENSRSPSRYRAPLQYACFLAARGHIEDARNYFQQAIATPGLPLKQFKSEVISYIGALISSKNWQEVLDLCEQHAIYLVGEQWASAVDILIEDSSYETLEQLARKHLAIRQDYNYWAIDAPLIISLIKLGRYSETLPYLGTIRGGKPTLGSKQVQAAAMTVIYLVRQHKFADAKVFMDFATRRGPDHPYTLLAQGEELLYKRDFTRSSQVIDRLLSSNPDFSLAHALHGQILSWQGNTLQANASFAKAAALPKKDSEALAKYCYFLTEESKFLLNVDFQDSKKLLNLALEQGEAAYQIEVTNPYVSNNFARALRIANDLERADLVIQKLLERCPDEIFALINAGEIKASRRKWADAIHYHETAISVASERHVAQAKGAMGKLLLTLGDKLGAYQYLKEALDLAKSSASASMDMAEWYLYAGDLSKAEALLQGVVTKAPRFVHARLRLADLLVTMNKTNQAIVAYSKLAIECWESGGLLATTQSGYSVLRLINLLDDLKLQNFALVAGLLAGRSACWNPYTQHTAESILQEIASRLNNHPKTRELLEAQIRDLDRLLLPERITKTDGHLTSSNPEKFLIQFLRAQL